MSKNGKVLFRGRSGRTYQFQVYDLGARFKAVGGVCVLSKRTYSNASFSRLASHHSVHIGQTSDLSSLPYEAPGFDGCDCVCVYLEPDRAERLVVESDLADTLGMWTRDFRIDLDRGSATSGDAIQIVPAVHASTSEEDA